MRYQCFVSSVLFCAICALGTTMAQAVVVPFDTTGAMSIQSASGYNTMSVNASGSYAGITGHGSTSFGVIGGYLLGLQGNYNAATNTVDLSGIQFIKQSGAGQLRTSPNDVSMGVYTKIIWEVKVDTVNMNGLAIDLDSQGTVASVSGGSFTTTGSTIAWLNGGTVSDTGGNVNNNYASGGSPGPSNFAASGYTGSVQVIGTPTVSGNLAAFNARAILPINISQNQDGVSLTMSGSVYSGGTFYARAPATYTWSGTSGTWSTVGNWNLGSFAPGNGYDSIVVTNGGTIDLSGNAQSVVNVGTASNAVVGNIVNGSMNFTGDMYLKSGTVTTGLTNSGGSGRLWIGGNSAATVVLGGENSVTYSDTSATIIGHSTTGAAGTVKLNSANALNAAGQRTDVYSGTLDLNGQTNVRSAQIGLQSGSSSALVNNSGTASTSAGIHLAAAGSQIGGSGNLALNGAISGNGGFIKVGSGAVIINASASYTGGTTVSVGTLTVNGSIASSSGVEVASGAVLNGSGVVSTISGAGSVNPGNSPGILTASSLVPNSGLSLNFEMTQNGSPIYTTASASGNDVLHLTASTPITSAMTSANSINVYFAVSDFLLGNKYRGGVYVDNTTNFLTNIKSALYNYYVMDSAGTTIYNGNRYSSLAQYDSNYGKNLKVELSVVSETAGFATGTVTGEVMQFSVVPEPGTIAILITGCVALAGMGLARLRRR